MRAVNLLPSEPSPAAASACPAARSCSPARRPSWRLHSSTSRSTFEHAKVSAARATSASRRPSSAGLGPAARLPRRGQQLAVQRQSSPSRASRTRSAGASPGTATLDQVARVLPANVWLTAAQRVVPDPGRRRSHVRRRGPGHVLHLDHVVDDDRHHNGGPRRCSRAVRGLLDHRLRVHERRCCEDARAPRPRAEPDRRDARSRPRRWRSAAGRSCSSQLTADDAARSGAHEGPPAAADDPRLSRVGPGRCGCGSPARGAAPAQQGDERCTRRSIRRRPRSSRSQATRGGASSAAGAASFQLSRAMPYADDMPGILLDLSRTAAATSTRADLGSAGRARLASRRLVGRSAAGRSGRKLRGRLAVPAQPQDRGPGRRHQRARDARASSWPTTLRSPRTDASTPSGGARRARSRPTSSLVAFDYAAPPVAFTTPVIAAADGSASSATAAGAPAGGN